MSKVENPEVKIFGFQINRTGIIILSYISLTICIQFILELYYYGQSLISLIINYAFPEILAYIDDLIQMIIIFFILLTLISLLVTIFVLCVKMQKSFKNEDTSARWIIFSLTKSSSAVLFILSIVYILLNSYIILRSIGILIFYISRSIPQFFFVISQEFIYLIGALTLTVINIYTLVVCVSNRKPNR